jgi:putative ubiquitin-RnfH superfamily antitoxin RatB of RatAB toxin-antitoxin module
MGEQQLLIEVAYARPDEQVVLELEVQAGASVVQAVMLSGILQQYPEIEFAQAEVGIFGQVCDKEKTLEAGDRVEIYRSLIRSPKEARKLRATKQ